MANKSILLFEYYLLTAQVFSQGFVQKAREKAAGAASIGEDRWHDELFKLELVQKTIEATVYDQLKSRLLTPSVIWPEQIVPSKRVNIGAVITLEEEGYPEETYLLTGDTVVPEYGLITVESPLGRSLLDSAEGSTVDIKIPAGSREVKVLRVGYDVSAPLTRYLGYLCKDAGQKLKAILVISRLAAFSTIAEAVRNKTAEVAKERDYYEFMASVVAHTARLEATLLVIEAYRLSSLLEEDCKGKIATYRRLLEEHGIPFESMNAADYCHPKPL
jgi:transcription elongation GreA/GreB family factor